MTEEKPKSKRGFAAMSPAKRRAIAKLGGAAVPKEKRSFSTNKKLAREAGRNGGKAIPVEKRSFYKDPKLAAEAGRRGGVSNGKRKRQEKMDI